MNRQYSKISESRLAAAEKVLSASLHCWTTAHARDSAPAAPRVFVTVSRQPGAGGISFSHRLAQRLNATGADDWSAWDRELVERVAAEHHIPRDLIELMPDRHRSWFTTFIDAISENPHGPGFAELRAYKRIVAAIRALAEQGHAVIVGLGGTFVTEQMPGAIHLRLVAPLEHRIKHVAEREQLRLHEAAQRVTEMDSHRAEFFHQFWHRKTIAPDDFTMTLNAGELSVDEMVEVVLPLVRSREAALKGRSAQHVQLAAEERKQRHETSYCI